MTILGQKIKSIRTQHKLTQKSFGDLVGVSYAHISSIEAGKDYPSKTLIKAICTKFNIEESWLIDDEDENFVIQAQNILKNNFTSLIKESEMSKADILNKIDISSSDYFLLELGNPNINISTLVKISDYFNVSLDWLIKGKEHAVYHSANLSVEEISVLDDYKLLDTEEKEMVRILMKKLLVKK